MNPDDINSPVQQRDDPAVVEAPPAVTPLDVKVITEQAKASVELLERRVANAKRDEKNAVEHRRQQEAELKDAKALLSRLAGSPLKGTKRSTAKPAAK